MESLEYLRGREVEISPISKPMYLESTELWAFRIRCVDRIYQMATYTNATDATAFLAVRLMDKCLMSFATHKRVDMALFMVACFNISTTLIDREWICTRLTDYMRFATFEENEIVLDQNNFRQHFLRAQASVISITHGDMNMPTPFQFLYYLGGSELAENRYVCTFVGTLAYSMFVTKHTSFEIAAAVLGALWNNFSDAQKLYISPVLRQVKQDKYDAILRDLNRMHRFVQRISVTRCGYTMFFM